LVTHFKDKKSFDARNQPALQRSYFCAVKQGLTEWLGKQRCRRVICLQDVRVREYKVVDDPRFCPEGFEAILF
jgi:exonuclease III